MRSLSFSVLLLLSPTVGKAFDFRVSAPSAALMNLDTGQILWEKRPEMPLPVASLTKVGTALYILETYPDRLDEMVTVRPEVLRTLPHAQRLKTASHLLDPEASIIGLKPHEQMSVRSLLEGLMICSGDDAANALADHFGEGSISTFMEGMNLFLRKLGCTKTHFSNPSGLEFFDHVSTTQDLALMTFHAMRIPLFRRIVGTASYARPATNLQEAKTLRTTNRLLRSGPLRYEKATGIKTGFLQCAKCCLISSAKNEFREVAAILLGSSNGKLRFEEAIMMMDAALNEAHQTRVYHPGGLIGRPYPIRGAATPLQARVFSPLKASIFPSEENPVRISMEWDSYLTPPLPRDALVGKVRVLDSWNRILCEEDLVAASPVEATWTFRIARLWNRWGRWGNLLAMVSLCVMCGSWVWALTRPKVKPV